MLTVTDVSTFASDYLKMFQTGKATELSYRGFFETLFNKGNNVLAINDGKKLDDSKPDFQFKRRNNTDLLIGYAEMKDPGVSLDDVENTNQWNRYKKFTNIFLTDGIEWRFYSNGTEYKRVVIAVWDKSSKTIVNFDSTKYETLVETLNDFFTRGIEKIKSGKQLARIMGVKARQIRDYVLSISDEDSINNEEINDLYELFKSLLVSDLSISTFADMYAQTMVYGLFVARYNDTTEEDFSRIEARELIPDTNPLLRTFFDHIAGIGFAKELHPVVNQLCEVLNVCDVKTVVSLHVNNDNDDKDPVVHFYEDFLKSYDNALRNKMGAYYTPTAVVRYIIRAVDFSLINDFGVSDGIASSETTSYDRPVVEGYKKGKGTGKNTYYEESIEIPKIQILDPAVGTGTFLNETIKYIYNQYYSDNAGLWNGYVNENLMKRLNGFEVMMTPYTMSHLKLSMTLKDLGADVESRLKIYLTDTLADNIDELPPLIALATFGRTVTHEAELAAEVKKRLPVMAIIGNPPYSIHSTNNSSFVKGLMKPYKTGLNEKKSNLDDDYVKFIRFSENMIENNGQGIVAMITNNSYLKGSSHRLMREHLMKTFDKIYVLNLHGSLADKEIVTDNGKDQNVFNIKQGVSIVVMIKNNSKKGLLGEVFYAELIGSRKYKFRELNSDSINYSKLDCIGPNYYFVPKTNAIYEDTISIKELFPMIDSGFRTGDSTNQICFTKKDVEELIKDFVSLSEREYREKYKFEDYSGHKYSHMKKDDVLQYDPSRAIKVMWHSIFDVRYTYYSEKSSGFNMRPRAETLNNLAYHSDNYALLFMRGGYQTKFTGAGVVKYVTTESVFSTTNCDKIAPFICYSKDGLASYNFNKEKLLELVKNLKEWTYEGVFDYIYAVLNSKAYMEYFADSLDTNYPEIPIPSNEEYERLCPLGKELREIHLMNKKLKTSTTFPIQGDNKVENTKYQDNRIYINETQYFGNVSEDVWNCFIGARQPAKMWLKDRKGRKLSYEEILYFQQILAIQKETLRIISVL